MEFSPKVPSLIAAVIAALAAAAANPGAAAAQAACSGHNLLAKPRPETSCTSLKPEIFVSPDKASHATVLPSDVSLFASPDMESRVVLRSAAGVTLTSHDYSSPRGTDGFYVVHAQWSPDSQYFAFSLSSSGGHSPWSFPVRVYSVKQNRIADFSAMIGGNPTVSADFRFSGPNTLVATTWKKAGSPEDKIPVTVDLAAAFEKLPAK